MTINTQSAQGTTQTKEELAKQFLEEIKQVLDKYDASIKFEEGDRNDSDQIVFELWNTQENQDYSYLYFNLKTLYIDNNCVYNLGTIL